MMLNMSTNITVFQYFLLAYNIKQQFTNLSAMLNISTLYKNFVKNESTEVQCWIRSRISEWWQVPVF